MFDLGPAARELARLVGGIEDDQLGAPTPCPDWTLGDLLDHVHELTTVFTCNARGLPVADVRLADHGRLPDGWRARLTDRLEALPAAWAEPGAWEGRVTVGGIDMTREDNAVVAVEELVSHGWDVARASGQSFAVEAGTLDEAERFLAVFGGPLASGEGPFGPPVPVGAGASRLDGLLGALGRDPGWAVPDGG